MTRKWLDREPTTEMLDAISSVATDLYLHAMAPRMWLAMFDVAPDAAPPAEGATQWACTRCGLVRVGSGWWICKTGNGDDICAPAAEPPQDYAELCARLREAGRPYLAGEPMITGDLALYAEAAAALEAQDAEIERLRALADKGWHSAEYYEAARDKLQVRAEAAEARCAELVALLTEARDDVAELVNQCAANWGDRLMHKQKPGVDLLARIDAALGDKP